MKRRAFLIASSVAAISMFALATGSLAKTASPWDGTWSGSWGGQADTSISIAGGQVISYKYKGGPVPIKFQNVSGKTVSFGIKGNYDVKLQMTGPTTASATFHSPTLGDAAADLTKN